MGISQIIVGGESDQAGKKARLFNLGWAYDTLEQCRAADVACFIKQLGSNPYGTLGHLPFKHRAGADPAEWSEELRVQEWPT